MTQSINVKHVLIAVSIPVFLHSLATYVLVCNGLNFSDWSEQVQFHLGVLDLNFTFQIEKHTTTIDTSSNEDKVHYKA